MIWVEAIAAGTVILSVVCFLLFVVDLRRLPTGERPTITPLDRLGHALPAAENPDYRDTTEEHKGD